MTVEADAGDDRPVVIGIRTRYGDQVRWARWSGGAPAAGQGVTLPSTGESGRVVVLPESLIPAPGPERELEWAVAFVGTEAPPEQRLDGDGAWGRIGHRGPASADPGSDMASRESDAYLALKAAAPRIGDEVTTNRGTGVVVRSNPFTGTVDLRLDPGSEIVTLSQDDVTKLAADGGET